MARENRRSSGIHVGSASIVMIFAVLCLTVFSTLSFVTANHERKLAEKSALAVQQYYQADWACEEMYQRIYEHLASGAPAEELTALGVELTEQDGVERVSYSAPIDSEQRLRVTLALLPDGSIRTEEWKAEAVNAWEYSEDIEVWDGE